MVDHDPDAPLHRSVACDTPIDGESGLPACFDGRPVPSISIDTDGERILAAYTVLNPDKLKNIVSPQDGD